MISLLGVLITVVEAGTEVGKDADGNPMIVTDESAVFNGARVWVTQKIYDKMQLSFGGGEERLVPRHARDR